MIVAFLIDLNCISKYGNKKVGCLTHQRNMTGFNFDPKGRRAIVTGGAQGIGSEFARQLVGAGAKVCICDIDISVGKEFTEKLRKEYGVGKDRCNDKHFFHFSKQ